MLPTVLFFLFERFFGEDMVDAADRLEYGLALLIGVDRCPALLRHVQLICAEADNQSATAGGSSLKDSYVAVVQHVEGSESDDCVNQLLLLLNRGARFHVSRILFRCH